MALKNKKTKAGIRKAAMAAKPEKGESKQDFLKRCMAGDKDQLAACAVAWNHATLNDSADKGRVHLLSDPGSVEAGNENGEFVILAYTGKIIDWWWMDPFVLDLTGMALAKSKVPSLLEHIRDWRVGSIDTGASSDAGFVVSGKFLSNELAQGVRQDAADGYPWQASIGVQALRVEVLKEGESAEVNGQTVEGPIDIWRKSLVFETSFCSFGADDDTAAIAMSATAITLQEDSMNKRLRNFLVSRGLNADATDQEAWAFLSQLDLKPEEAKEAGLSDSDLKPDNAKKTGRDNPAPQPAGTAAALSSVQQPGTAPAGAPASGADQLLEVQDLSAKEVLDLSVKGGDLGLSAKEISTALAGCVTRESAMLALYQAAEKKNPPFGSGTLEMGMDEADKFRLAATDGVCARMGLKVDKPAAGADEFRVLSLHELARVCLDRQGVSTKTLSRVQLAKQIIRLSAGGVSTSDFASIFMDAANRTLLRAYTESPETWRPLVNIVPASDFKTIYGISLSEAPDLDLIGENGEYKTGHLKDNQESYSVGKYGKILSLTLEMIVNDDLRAFSRIPQLLGAAAKRKVADVVYGLITSNPTMNDGSAVFSSAHSNLATTGGLVTADTLSVARTAMRKQKGRNGATLDISPAILLHPVAQETSVEILLRSTALPSADMSSGVHNPWAGKLQPISDPRLDAVSEKAWYLFGSPSQVDTVEVAFLDGNEQPYLEENDEFVRDAVSYKCRHIFGAGWQDAVGVYKNPGE